MHGLLVVSSTRCFSLANRLKLRFSLLGAMVHRLCMYLSRMKNEHGQWVCRVLDVDGQKERFNAKNTQTEYTQLFHTSARSYDVHRIDHMSRACICRHDMLCESCVMQIPAGKHYLYCTEIILIRDLSAPKDLDHHPDNDLDHQMGV